MTGHDRSLSTHDMTTTGTEQLASAVAEAYSDYRRFQSDYLKGRLTALTYAYALANGYPWDCSDDETIAREYALLENVRRLAQVLVHDCDPHGDLLCHCFAQADVDAYERAVGALSGREVQA